MIDSSPRSGSPRADSDARCALAKQAERGGVECGLGSMGPKAADAVPALIQALGDPEPFVRAPAEDALGHIGPAAKSAAMAPGNKLLTSPKTLFRSVTPFED